LYVRRFLLVGFLAMVAVGCNNAQNSGTGVVTTAPTATPTASPVPTATPVPPKSENYFPITNQAAYDGTSSGGGTVFFGKGTLVNGAAIGTACSTALGTFGDFWVRVSPSIIPVGDIVVNPAYAYPLISKNAAGDVYVVGYTSSTGTGETCIQPYPIAKAQMVKGTGWTFVDIAGVSRTAVVVSDHQTMTFTAQTSGGPVPTTYTAIVAQVAYGSDQTIYWAAGYGPVQTVDPGAPPAPSGQPAQFYPQTLTAHDWTLDPTSK
jgi:hypothetical protein